MTSLLPVSYLRIVQFAPSARIPAAPDRCGWMLTQSHSGDPLQATLELGSTSNKHPCASLRHDSLKPLPSEEESSGEREYVGVANRSVSVRLHVAALQISRLSHSQSRHLRSLLCSFRARSFSVRSSTDQHLVQALTVN